MNHKQIFILLFLFIIFFTSCKTSFNVVNISDTTAEKTGIIYTLPKTKLIINFEITETHKLKGPFADYTRLYFNSKNAILKNEVEFKITDVTAKTIPIKDPQNVYALNSFGNISVSMLNLTPAGFLAGINLSDYQAEKVQTEQKIITKSYTIDQKLDYADFSLKSIRETQYDTLYKEVLKDSILVRIPIIRKKKVLKSTEKQAKEIADILFLLRDDRNALLKGENDGNNFPDGEGLKLMIKELNSLEKQYLSLFTGREAKRPKNYDFEILPDKNSLSFEIFRFSNKTGISYDSIGEPVILTIYTDLSIPVVENFNQAYFKNLRKEGKAFEGLIYRMPADLIAEISFNNKILYKKQLRLSQLGTINLIPEHIINEQTSIEFYPQYGSLKRISKINTKED